MTEFQKLVLQAIKELGRDDASEQKIVDWIMEKTGRARVATAGAVAISLGALYAKRLIDRDTSIHSPWHII